ncbi:MAG: hypothetical protein CVU78_03815 [Elusimicrobia bacterium HGW-Elusimicrobia-2]|nr:MAG: hypothetical protein CVU78_03815 [Elusimicrobia bacterium HGW-Elusimicrobia-2]
MEWKKIADGLLACEKKALVRSLKVPDSSGTWRRYRISTVWEQGAEKFSLVPGEAMLVMDEGKSIGLRITGRDSGLVKIGKNLGVQQQILTSFNAVSKKAVARLTSGLHLEFYEEEERILAKERGSE